MKKKYSIAKFSFILFVCIVMNVFQPNIHYCNIICLLCIILFGIPHGAIDHKIHSTLNVTISIKKYVFTYVMIAIGYIIWWMVAPFKAMLFFLIMSAYHFGQELLENRNIKVKTPIESMVWGFIILFLPLLLSFEEVKATLFIVTGQKIILSDSFKNLLVLSIVLMALLHLLLLLHKKVIHLKEASYLIGFIFLICSIYSVLPFLVAFTLYFVLFHSLNTLKHQFDWMKLKKKKYSIKKFIIDLSAFSIIAIIGLLFLLYWIQPNNWVEIIIYFFIIISIITLPHTILFDQFYKNSTTLKE